ncbi:hypothetical protein L6R53_15735 [Myxococcota bacterium]|nr:hypothetical protein [Myxococcota bacterium]
MLFTMLVATLAVARAQSPKTEINPLLVVPAISPKELVGTWNVTSSATGVGTCEQAALDAVTAYQWIVSLGRDNQVSVSVVGETAFPKLEGKVDGAVLRLNGHGTTMSGGGQGEADGFPIWIYNQPTSMFALRPAGDGTTWTGSRWYLGFNTLQGEYSADHGTWIHVPCVVEFAVEARKQQ